MTNGPISIPVDELNKVRDGWALAIGRFLAAFTSCEYWTYLYIGTFGSERLREAVTEMNLGPRIKLAQALVTDIGLIEVVQARVDAAFEKLRKLSGPRNIVAHNGPMVRVYRNTKTGVLEVRHELRSARDPTKDMTIAKLDALQAEAEELDEELALLYGEVRQPQNHLPKAPPLAP